MGNKLIKNIVISIVACVVLMICGATALAQIKTTDTRVVYIDGEPSYDKVETINSNFTDLSVKRVGGFECAGFVEVDVDSDTDNNVRQWEKGDMYIRIVHEDDVDILETKVGSTGKYIKLCEVWPNGRDYIKIGIEDFEKATGTEVEIQGNVYDTNGDIVEPEHYEIPKEVELPREVGMRKFISNIAIASAIITGIAVVVSVMFIVKKR